MGGAYRALASTLILLSSGLAPGCGSSSESCDMGDRTYDDGAQWTCSDGCNHCGCDDGVVSSTLIGCATPPGPAAGMLKCEEAGAFHTHGEEWMCVDGCACSCSDGRLTRACEPD